LGKQKETIGEAERERCTEGRGDAPKTAAEIRTFSWNGKERECPGKQHKKRRRIKEFQNGRTLQPLINPNREKKTTTEEWGKEIGEKGKTGPKKKKKMDK